MQRRTLFSQLRQLVFRGSDLGLVTRMIHFFCNEPPRRLANCCYYIPIESARTSYTNHELEVRPNESLIVCNFTPGRWANSNNWIVSGNSYFHCPILVKYLCSVVVFHPYIYVWPEESEIRSVIINSLVTTDWRGLPSISHITSLVPTR